MTGQMLWMALTSHGFDVPMEECAAIVRRMDQHGTTVKMAAAGGSYYFYTLKGSEVLRDGASFVLVHDGVVLPDPVEPSLFYRAWERSRAMGELT